MSAPSRPPVAVIGPPGLMVALVERVVTEAGLGRTSSSDQAAARHPKRIVVLVDPSPVHWAAAEALGGRLIFVCTAHLDHVEMVRLVVRGVHAVLDGRAGPGELLQAVDAVSRGSSYLTPHQLDLLLGFVRLIARVPMRAALSDREREVLQHIASGDSIKETAAALGVAYKTIENTQSRLFKKLAVRNRAEAASISSAVRVLEVFADQGRAASPTPGRGVLKDVPKDPAVVPLETVQPDGLHHPHQLPRGIGRTSTPTSDARSERLRAAPHRRRATHAPISARTETGDEMRRRATLVGLAAALVTILGTIDARATVTALSIDDAPSVVAAGDPFDVTFTWDHAHCNNYGSTVTLGSLATPLAQKATDYSAADLDCPGPNTRTESLTVPASAPYGPTDLTVDVAEFTAGNGFNQTEVTSVYIAAGYCPPSWVFQNALGPDDPYDKNGDGLICTKGVGGQGNSVNSQRGGGAASVVGHVDGHNHKDNNNPL